MVILGFMWGKYQTIKAKIRCRRGIKWLELWVIWGMMWEMIINEPVHD